MRAAALATLLALSACASDATTGIVVEVSSDLAVTPEQQFNLRVFSAAGTLVRALSFHDGELPARLQLVPEGGATTVTVEATAPVGTLSRRATLTFRPGALLLVRLPLEAACACVPCSEHQTCEAGRCMDVVKDVATLSVYAPPSSAPGMKVAVPACSGDAPAPADAGDADTRMRDGPPQLPADASGAEAPSADVALPAPDGPSPDTAAPVDTRAPDAATTPDAPAAPDAPGAPDLSADRAPDQALPIDTAPPAPDLPTLRADGEACTTSDQCVSHACVDHVCCHTACVGPCLACDNVHTGAANGQCAPVLGGTDPDGDCAADPPMSCGYDGLCNGAGACRFYPASTQCAAATCIGSTFTPARNCTGAGACASPAPQNCDQFLCTSTQCPGTCQSHAACISTAYCDGNTCLAKKAALKPCNANYECQSNSCLLSGVCL